VNTTFRRDGPLIVSTTASSHSTYVPHSSAGASTIATGPASAASPDTTNFTTAKPNPSPNIASEGTLSNTGTLPTTKALLGAWDDSDDCDDCDDFGDCGYCDGCDYCSYCYDCNDCDR
jgi:hypothetical protein